MRNSPPNKSFHKRKKLSDSFWLLGMRLLSYIRHLLWALLWVRGAEGICATEAPIGTSGRPCAGRVIGVCRWGVNPVGHEQSRGR